MDVCLGFTVLHSIILSSSFSPNSQFLQKFWEIISFILFHGHFDFFSDPRLRSEISCVSFFSKFRQSQPCSHFIFEHFVLISHSNKIRDRVLFGSQLNIDNQRERFALKARKVYSRI